MPKPTEIRAAAQCERYSMPPFRLDRAWALQQAERIARELNDAIEGMRVLHAVGEHRWFLRCGLGDSDPFLDGEELAALLRSTVDADLVRERVTELIDSLAYDLGLSDPAPSAPLAAPSPAPADRSPDARPAESPESEERR